MTVSLTLYHGTSRSRAEIIETSGFTYTKQRKPLSYGDGAYFYRDLDKAREYAQLDNKENACVLEVEVTLAKERVLTITRYDTYNRELAYYNRTAIEQQMLMLDVSVDDGIYVVRPEALPLIRVRRHHV